MPPRRAGPPHAPVFPAVSPAPERATVTPPSTRRGAVAPAGASGLEAAVEAMAARLERYGFSVRGADPVETRHNLERLRRERPDLFGLLG